jgi:hypothetical protein
MTIREHPLADVKEVIVARLQLLDLMIREERDAVSMDAVTRAALIGLMARVVVTVFQGEGGTKDRSGIQSQDQTGAPSSQRDCLSSAVHREASPI